MEHPYAKPQPDSGKWTRLDAKAVFLSETEMHPIVLELCAPWITQMAIKNPAS